TAYASPVVATGFAGSAAPCSYVTTGCTTGIESLQPSQPDDTDDDDTEIYYTPDGRRANPLRLAPGMYIIKKGNTSSKLVIVHR
ncbi:MAG: hypothetical protein K2I19_03175, partial [Muribaculaceae bacterium]|nr:hypothetical protein [Muribaculaceae bacterium]